MCCVSKSIDRPQVTQVYTRKKRGRKLGQQESNLENGEGIAANGTTRGSQLRESMMGIITEWTGDNLWLERRILA